MEAFRKIYPAEFYRRFLVHGVRPDGRDCWAVRPTSIVPKSVSCASSSCLVKIGGTSVLAGAKLEVGAPVTPHTEAREGSETNTRSVTEDEAVEQAGTAATLSASQIIVNVELPALCSSKFRSSKAGSSARHVVNSIAWRLNYIVNSMPLVNAGDLLFDDKGKLVWYIFVDIYCLDYDGAPFDACLLALLGTLQSSTITDCGTPVINESDPGRPLKLLHHPIALSFSLFDEHVLTDPCDEEEGIQAGSLTVVCNENGKLCDVYKPGGAPLDAAVLEKCVTRTAKRVTESLELLKNSCS